MLKLLRHFRSHHYGFVEGVKCPSFRAECSLEHTFKQVNVETRKEESKVSKNNYFYCFKQGTVPSLPCINDTELKTHFLKMTVKLS